ncbi:histidine kinase [Bifidobacterium aerophilum]|uniref:histidine kinase n=1 Tax=Bifidobacterium aerophilum TaxID=1798155 RepID=A0A6N9Z322_9BIFI|nr:histidine kinase [Bifidobacterium aerophilum]NEG88653.1 hypothetical protein [Bifidobacterium aerophilum]
MEEIGDHMFLRCKEGLHAWVSRCARVIPHPWILLISSVVGALDVISSLATNQYNVISDIALIAHLVALIGISRYCIPCSYAVVIIYVISLFVPDIPANDQIVGVCFAIGVFFAMNRKVPGIVSVVSLTAITFYNGFSSGMSNMPLLYAMGTSLFFVIAASGGIAAAGYSRANEMEKKNAYLSQQLEHMKYLERDVRLSRDLHDSLTNDLSFIAIIAQARQRNAIKFGDAEAAQAWRQVGQRVQTAFDHTHMILDQLQGEEVRHDKSCSDSLREELTDVKRTLATSGFHGECIFAGSNADLPNDVYEELRSLILECSTNIMRHCVPNKDSFLMSLEINGGSIHLAQMNTIHDSQSSFVRSQRGLNYHCHIIQSLHGEMHYAIDGDTWVLSASIPLSSANSQPACS